MRLRTRTFRMLAVLATEILIACFSATECASAREPDFSEMTHKKWTAQDGAPQGVNALAQAPDGVLWVGSDSGLYSFDGRTFTEFQARPGEQDLPASRVESILISRDGDLWVGFRSNGVARLSHGRVTLFDPAGQPPLTLVQHIRQSSDGAIWALDRQRRIVRFGSDGNWHQEPTPLGEQGGRIRNIFIDASNTLWVDQGGRLYRRPLGQGQYFATGTEADWVFGYAEAADHSLWVTDVTTSTPEGQSARIRHIDPDGNVLARLPEQADTPQDLLYEPDGSLVMTSFDAGLLRWPAAALKGPSPLTAQAPRDRYGEKDGLSSNAVGPLLLDNDGNLWVGGQRGLDRFRTARFVAFPLKNGATLATLCAGKNGDVWIAAGLGAQSVLYKVSSGATQLLPYSTQVISPFCGPDGDTWLAARTGVWNIHAGQFTALPPIPDIAPLGLHEVVATPDHVLFATVSSTPGHSGIWRYAGGVWDRIIGPGVSPNAPGIEYLDSHGRLWAGYEQGVIGLPLEDGGKTLPSGVGAVHAITESTHGLFVGGVNGLAILHDGRFERVRFADHQSAQDIAGIIESGNGDLWLNAAHGIVHVRSEDWAATLRDPLLPLKSEVLTEGDFVGPAQVASGSTTVARDTNGNLWFATLSGVFHIDPGHLDSGIHPPILSIRSISADQKPVHDGGAIGPEAQTLVIEYLGVNLTTPESVSYRYRLDGLDDAWQDAGHRTVAIYAHLRPGTYTFRVSASNGDGAWTPAASAAFKVLPYYYQTIWFLPLCILAGLLLLWLAIAMRLRVINRESSARAEMQTALARANRLAAMGQVTASIAHEVNQPISGIITNTQVGLKVLSANPPDLEKINQVLTRTLRDGNRAAQVVQRVRVMTKMTPATKSEVALNDAIAEVVDMIRDQAVKHGISVRTELAQSLPSIQGDQVQLQQVVLNLIVNAIEAMSGTSQGTRELLIRTEAGDAGNVLVIVADSGPGLAPTALAKLFQPFYTTKPEGLGLGLSICRSIVEAHGGQLSARANAPHGAVFQFFVPAEQHS